MERPALLTLCLCLALPALAAAQAPDASWRLLREGDDVTVHARDVAGSRYVESWARTVVTARLSTLAALIMDGDGHSRWIDSIDESRVLERVSPTETYIYTITTAPWPVADRDAVVVSRVAQDRDTLVVTVRSMATPDRAPPREGTVRVATIESSWVLVPRPGGTVEVNYRVHNDPGGEIPAWLVNNVAADQPYNTLENLRRLLAGPNAYRDVTLPYIVEPAG